MLVLNIERLKTCFRSCKSDRACEYIELFLPISLVRKHWHQRKSSLFLSVSKNNLQKLKPSLHAADRGADAESTVVLRSNSASVHNAAEGAAVADEVNAPPLSFSLLSPLFCHRDRLPSR